MNRFLNEIRKQAQMAMADITYAKIGLVTGYNPDNYCVKVMLLPEDIETGWLPLLSPWVGNGWGMFCAPSINDLVEVQFEQGSSEAAFACMRFFTDASRPLPAPAGEFWLVHKLGASVKLTNDGKLLINGQAEIDLTSPVLNITVSGNATLAVSGNITSSAAVWNHSGPLNVSGDIGSSGTVTGSTDVIGGGKSLKTHIHTGGTISGKTGTPV
jgi:phage baseplate assembly protein V